VDLETLERKLAERNAKVGKLKQNLYRKLAAQLPDDLEVCAAGEGLSNENGSYAPVIVSPNTVYIARGAGAFGQAELVGFARDTITAVEVSGRILRKLTIVTVEGPFIVTAMSKKQARAIAEELEAGGR